MLGGVDGAAHRAEVARHAGSGFVVDDQHALDLVLTVLGQDRLDAVHGRSLAPLHVDDVHPHPVPLRQVDPQVAELSVARREQTVAGRQRIDERRFPAAGPRRGKDEWLAGGGLEHLLQVAEQAGRQVGERGRAVILHGAVHRAQDPLGHVGRSWDEEEITAGHKVVLDEREKQSENRRLSLVDWAKLRGHPRTATPRMGRSAPPKLRGGNFLHHRHRIRNRSARALRNMRAACCGGMCA